MAQNNLDHLYCEPQLVMVIEPENKLRFRYKTEGASHGGLLGKGKQSGKGKKLYPTVKLTNYQGNKHVFIRASLYTDDKQPHILGFIGDSDDDVPYIDEYLQKDNTAVFKNLRFFTKKKEEICEQLLDEKMQELGETRRSVRKRFEREYSKDFRERAKNIMNSVRLCFEAFEENSSERLCEPLFSELICNQKATSRGELRIHRMSRVSGSWKGGDEIILLCNRVEKENIKIIFYEVGDCCTDDWKENAIFRPADVHYQVAITFKTPQYKINTERTVFVCLSRNDERSEPLQFTYIPDFEENPSKKRKTYRTHEHVVPSLLSPSPCTSSSQNSNDSSESPRVHQPEVDNNDHFSKDFLDNFPGFGFEMSDVMDVGVLELLEDVRLFSGDNVLIDDGMIEDENLQERIVNQGLPLIDATEIDGVVGQMDVSLCLNESLFHIKQKSVIKSKSKQHNNKEQKVSSLLMQRDDSGNTLLHVAVRKNLGVDFIIKMSHFANTQFASTQFINMKNDYQKTALHIATEQNNKEVVKILLNEEADPNLKNTEGNNCYHLAAQGNYIDVMRFLLNYKHKQELNAFNYEGLTPLHIAVMKNSKDCYHLLKLHYANISTLDQKSGRSLLHYAVEFQPSFVTVLLQEKDIDVNIQDFAGNTPLHLACINENIEITKQLLTAGADPGVKNFKHITLDEDEIDDVFGQTPGDCTTNPEILEILRQASVKTQDSSDYMEKLCCLLDMEKKWKDVAVYVLDEAYISSLECSESPSKTLLQHMQKQHKEDFLGSLRNILSLTGPCEALELIKEAHS